MRKIIYTQPDGGIAIVHPIINTYPRREEITEAEAEKRAWDKLPKDAINPRFVENEAPSDRTFRGAWKADLTVDMSKAREIHRDRLRQMRAPMLTALDVAYQKADESGDATEKQRIATKKQALRDATADPVIDAARTPGELKVAIPDALK